MPELNEATTLNESSGSGETGDIDLPDLSHNAVGKLAQMCV